MLEGEPLEEEFAQPGLGASQPIKVGQVVVHLLHEFHFLIEEVALQEVKIWRSVGQNPGHEDLKEPGSASSPRPWRLPWHPGFYPTHLKVTYGCPGIEHCCHTRFVSSRDAQSPALLLGQFIEGAHSFQSRIIMMETEA